MLGNNVIIKMKEIFWKCGFDIRRSSHAIPLDLSQKVCSNPLELAYRAANRDMLIKVPLSKCIHFDWGAFKTTVDSESPYITTLIDYKNKTCKAYKGSKLELFYKNFQPKNMIEYMRLASVENQELELVGPFGAVYPWLDENPSKKEKFMISYLKKGHVIDGEKFFLEDGDQFFGPVSQKKGESEFRRLVEVYESIKNKGFIQKSGSHIMGTIIMDRASGQWSVLVRAGNHRVAALAVLEYETVTIHVSKEGLGGMVFLDDIGSWPSVINKSLTERECHDFAIRYLPDED